MPREVTCPKCEADISDTKQDYDPSVGVTSGGWYCEKCDVAVADWEMDDGSDWER